MEPNEPAKMATEKKYFTMLENHPEVFTTLAHTLGLPPSITFHDIYSFSPPSLAHIPRPCLALIAIIPLTPSWALDRQSEDARLGDPKTYYHGNSNRSSSAPIIWFQQTIGDACGSYALLHCSINGPAASLIHPGSTLDQIRKDAAPLPREERAELLYDNKAFEEAHQSVAAMGDTAEPRDRSVGLGQHFVGYVKANGRLWELEGSREGPLDRGELGDDEDVLSPKALELGLGRIIKLEHESGGQDLRFSCIAMALKDEQSE
ncbi:hypothetical protein QC762_110850 [Podospora pseudocomata]|uniref:Ubiquitin carboxyl-terminal hydrolase n=1 Tax=Podospora pseudocomata TaxID=2093779 RepID=A0ABR0GUS7_9PEZI|nr:hypothetical protein QC762_110850 [Podospora pseudocomata]